MEKTIKKENYEELAPVWSGVTGQEISEECVVPDTMPDIGSILDTEGIILLRGKETERGCVHLTVSIAASVLFAPEDGGGVRSIELTLPAELRIDASGVDEECRAVAGIRLRNLEARAANSRKIALRGEVEADVRCFRRQELSVPVGLQSEEKSVHILEKTAEAAPVADVREKTFVVTDGYPLPSGCVSVDRILSRRAEAVLDDVKYVSEKLVFRGRVISELLIRDENEGLFSGRYETEFSQIMEIDGGDGEASPQVVLMLTGIFFDPPERGREQDRISAEIHLAAQCVCRSMRDIHYMADIYSSLTELIPEFETLVLPAEFRSVSLCQTVTGRAEPAPVAGTAIRTFASVGGITAEGNTVRTNVSVRVLLRSEDGAYLSARCRLPAEFTVSDLNADASLRDITVTVTDVYCGAGGTDVRAVLQMDALAVTERRIACVSSVEENASSDQAREREPSVVLVRVPAGADIWSLAKRYHSTVNGILSANEGRQEGLLLIPKGR